MISRDPSGLSRTSALVTCSQTSRLRSASYVMPLHLYEKFFTSTTVPSGVYLRRTSPGMSENSRWCSFGCQIGPSVNVNPVAICSTDVPSSTSSKIASDFASIPRPVSVLVTVPPFASRRMSLATLIRRARPERGIIDHRASLAHEYAAVDVERRPCDVARVVGEEERRERGNLLGSAEAADG